MNAYQIHAKLPDRKCHFTVVADSTYAAWRIAIERLFGTDRTEQMQPCLLKMEKMKNV